MDTDRLSFLALLFGLCVAVVVWLIPVRNELAYWRPPLVLLLVVYWSIREPRRFGVVFAWLVGLAIDLLFGQILGQHALAMSVAAYLVMALQNRLQHFKMLHHCFLVAMIVLAYEVVLLSATLLVEDVHGILPQFYPVLSSALLWPLIYVALQKLHGDHW